MEEETEMTRIDFTLLAYQNDGVYKDTGDQQSFFLKDLRSMDFKIEGKVFAIRHPKDGWLYVAENPWEIIRNHQS